LTSNREPKRRAALLGLRILRTWGRCRPAPLPTVSQPLAPCPRAGRCSAPSTRPGSKASGCGPSNRVFPARPGRDWLWCAGESFQCMGRDSVELVRRAYLAWQEGDLEGLLSLLDPQVTWSPVLRFLEGRRTAVGHRAVRRWFRWIRITYRSVEPLPRHFEDHGQRCWCSDGSSAGAGSGRATSTWRWRECGRCAANASPPCRRSETSVRHDCDPRPRLTPSTAFERSRHWRGRSARSPHCRRNPKRALRGHAGASPPAAPRDPGRIQRARRRLLARGRTPAPDTPPPPEMNDRDGPHIRKRRRPEPARRSGISPRRGQEADSQRRSRSSTAGPRTSQERPLGASIALGLATRRPELGRGVIAREQPLTWVAVDDPDVQPLLASSAPCR
jgi:hypothetical protein